MCLSVLGTLYCSGVVCLSLCGKTLSGSLMCAKAYLKLCLLMSLVFVLFFNSALEGLLALSRHCGEAVSFFFCEHLSASMARSLHLSLSQFTTSQLAPWTRRSQTAASPKAIGNTTTQRRLSLWQSGVVLGLRALADSLPWFDSPKFRA